MESEMKNFIREVEYYRNKFWYIDYPKLSRLERKNVWYRDICSGMRRQPEEMQDEYDAFSKEWYDFAKKIEPEFDNYFKEIANDLKSYLCQEFDWNKYKKRIEI